MPEQLSTLLEHQYVSALRAHITSQVEKAVCTTLMRLYDLLPDEHKGPIAADSEPHVPKNFRADDETRKQHHQLHVLRTVLSTQQDMTSRWYLENCCSDTVRSYIWTLRSLSAQVDALVTVSRVHADDNHISTLGQLTAQSGALQNHQQLAQFIDYIHTSGFDLKPTEEKDLAVRARAAMLHA